MIKMRLHYAKEEQACLLSHHEIQAALVRWLRRSDLPLMYTEGFNERVRIETGIPTAVGMASNAEYVDVFLASATPMEARIAALDQTTPPGIRLFGATDIALATPSLMALPMILRYDLAWPRSCTLDAGAMKDAAAAFLARETVPVNRENSRAPGTREPRRPRQPKDIRAYVLTVQFVSRMPVHIHIGVFFDQTGTIRMDEIMTHILGLSATDVPRPVCTRDSVLIKIDDVFVDPMTVEPPTASRRVPRKRHAAPA